MFKLGMPTEGVVTSKFGFRWKPKKGWHSGLDIANKEGTPIQAAYWGKVIAAGPRGNYGIAIVIEHPSIGKVWTLYGHLLSTMVAVGTKVNKGQVIGKMDSTGYSTGSHLHFEVRVGFNGILAAKNPERYLI